MDRRTDGMMDEGKHADLVLYEPEWRKRKWKRKRLEAALFRKVEAEAEAEAVMKKLLEAEAEVEALKKNPWKRKRKRKR